MPGDYRVDDSPLNYKPSEINRTFAEKSGDE
jgi:hypothetical protein